MIPSLNVAGFRERLAETGLELTALAPEGDFERSIAEPDLHRPGLSLVGHFFHHHPERVQVFGETELTFLENRGTAETADALDRLMTAGVPCCIVTRGLEPPPQLRAACERHRVALLRTSAETGAFMRQAGRVLADLLAPTTVVHGVMVDVFGIGVLITGPSGIGKSECALELVLRGHRLVADDMVEIRLRAREGLICRSMELIKHHMEIRGLGIINVQDLFGVASVRDQKRLELIVALEYWDPEAYYDRLGTDEQHRQDILGVDVEEVRVPVRPGRTLSVIIEIAARNRLLKIRGVDSAKRFQEKLLNEIASAAPGQRVPPNPPLRDDPE